MRRSVVDAIDQIVSEHLPEPGFVMLSRDHVTIMPEFSDAPVTALLMWAMRLEGGVRYDASLMWAEAGTAPTAVRAHGFLAGVPTTISASTRKTLPKLVHPSVADVYLQEVEVLESELRQFASDERII